MTQTEVHPRATLRSVHNAMERQHRRSVSGRVGAMAKAVVDLHDRSTVETNQRLDRLDQHIDRVETLLVTGFAEMRDGFRLLRADLTELTSRLNRIEARVMEHARWIADDEGNGKESQR